MARTWMMAVSARHDNRARAGTLQLVFTFNTGWHWCLPVKGHMSVFNMLQRRLKSLRYIHLTGNCLCVWQRVFQVYICPTWWKCLAEKWKFSDLISENLRFEINWLPPGGQLQYKLRTNTKQMHKMFLSFITLMCSVYFLMRSLYLFIRKVDWTHNCLSLNLTEVKMFLCYSIAES